MKYRLLLCFLILGVVVSTLVGQAFAFQELEIDARFSAESARPGEQITLQVNLDVPEGFHIYGSKNRNNATTFSFADSVALAVAGDPVIPDGKRTKGKAGTERWLEGKVSLEQKFTVSEQAAGEITLSGKLNYMICNKQFCKPPTKKQFTATLRVDAGPEEKEETTDKQSAATVRSMFEAPVRIMSDGKPLNSDQEILEASPVMIDIDHDGKDELVIGGLSGLLTVFENTNEKESGDPVWSNRKIFQVEGKEFRLKNW